MKKGLYIIGVFAFLLAFAACEKCQKPAVTADPFATEEVNAVNRGHESGKDGFSTDTTDPDNVGGGIVDPEEDEDFDKDSEGK